MVKDINDYEKQAGLQESVIFLAKSYLRYMLSFEVHSEIKNGFENALDIENKLEKAKEFDVFTDDGDNIELRHEWADLDQAEANIVVASVNSAVNQIISYVMNHREAKKADIEVVSKLKLSGEGNLPLKEDDNPPDLKIAR